MKRPTPARISQLFFLLLFLVLFLMTEYRGSDRIGAAANGFFRANPLTAVSTTFAAKKFLPLLLPGLLLLVLALFLGRFYCGWICPLGTTLDLITTKIRKTGPIRALQGNLKYWLLLPLLTSSLFGVNLAGLLDPIALYLRALTFFFHPLLGETVRGGWKSLYGTVGDFRDHLDPAYHLLRDYLLPFRETLYPLAFLSALLFFLILFLERYERRTWCRRLCPLGTLLGLAARFGPLRRRPEALCPDCRACRNVCPTAFDQDLLQTEECILCMECSISCPSQRVKFGFGFKGRRHDTPIMERRVFLGGILGGVVLAKSFRFRDPQQQSTLLRPPGVRSEKVFLEKCVRCGECMKVCLRSALYPAFLQGGVESFYTPLLLPRLGYCEYNCTLCGQVCPTGAIPDLEVAAKQREVIGKAVFDKNHCLPFAKRIDCIVCEEHCPISLKAIRSELVEVKGFDGRLVQVKQPYVTEELCNGCGICENVCPLEGKAAIQVFAVKDHTPLSAPLGDSQGTPSTDGEEKMENYGYPT